MYGWLRQHTHNVLVHLVDASAPNPFGVVLCNPFKWDILLFISGWNSGWNSGCLCACINSKMNLFPQSQEQKQKSCSRHTQFYSTLCGWLCNQPMWCCPLQPIPMRFFVVHFWSKSGCFLPFTTANWISKHTHICLLVSAALKHQPTISILLLLR